MDRDIITPDAKNQEKLAGALSYLLFFLPILMEQKTEFTSLHMRQSFLLFVVYVAMSFVPIFGGIITLVAFIHAIFLAWKAYSGEKYAIPYIYNNSQKLIKLLNIDSFFATKK